MTVTANALPEVETTTCRRVTTYDSERRENGSLIELVKEGELTRAYMTTVLPGMCKGYHLHKIRACNFAVLRGTVRFILIKDGHPCRYDISDAEHRRLHVPPGVFIGLRNIGECEAWIFNYSNPPYDPADPNEQVDMPMNQDPSAE
jgi:dTDP-4-dehydrorhamnose 3,5-epimerase-like enzyme